MDDQMDELNLEVQQEDRRDKRIQQLTTQRTTLTQEREEAVAKAAAEAERAALLEKERDFFASFADMTGKYPSASEFKDQIKEKVMAGYTAEDATVAVLNAQGKLMPSAPVESAPMQAAGGSAATVITDAAKPVGEMTQAERRQQLVEAEKRGDLSLT